MDQRAANEATPVAPSAIGDHPPAVPALSESNVALPWACRVWARRRKIVGIIFVFLVLSVAVWLCSRQAYGWHHLAAGKQELQVDHCRDALGHFQTCLEIWPDDAACLLLAARAARRSDDFESADYYLTKCQAAPSVVDQAAVERILLRACRGEIDAVGNLCQAMLREANADAPLVLEALVVGELSLARFASASRYLDQWLEMAPDHPQAVFLKGRLQLQASNPQEALAFLKRAVELDPERDDARFLLAGLYLDLGQAREALPHLEEVCRRQPRNVLARARLGQDMVLLGREEEAIRILDEVLKHRPDLAIALLERGKLALRSGELPQAEDWLQQACKRDPGGRAAHYQLLQCLKQRGKMTEAKATQKRLDQIDQDATRMREIITIQLPQRRNDPDLQAELGEIFLNAGAVVEGVNWLERALQVDPGHARTHAALARHYQSLGQSSQAQHHRRLAGAESTRGTPK